MRMIPILKTLPAAIKTTLMLRDYQQQLVTDVRDAWNGGAKNILAVLPTGGGKTVCFSRILIDEGAPACAIAHRQELVAQMALSLARNGVRHRIIGPESVVRLAVNQQMRECGASYYDPGAQIAVAGVDTLIRRGKSLAAWLPRVKLWVIDEAHHVTGGTKPNKWGQAVKMFPNARGLGVTATPDRADGKGLGADSDGVFHALIEGPTQRELINRGHLTDYRLYAPPCDMQLSDADIGATGDYSRPRMKRAAQKSRIVGDVVEHYLRLAPGKRGVTFATDVETAEKIAAQFNAAGVPAAAVSAETPDEERAAVVRKLGTGELLMLVNVDIFGEGFDLPAIEVVILARPTESFALFAQQVGRALRPAPGKDRAIIIDHVGNIARHAKVVERGDELVIELVHRTWTLDRREKRSRSGAGPGEFPVATCLNPACNATYVRVKPACPYCGYAPEPAGRSRPEEVDGDLSLLDPAALAHLQGTVARVDMDPNAYREELQRQRIPHVGVLANVKRHTETQEAQAALREVVAWWAGGQRAQGRPDPESYRRFYFQFGVDVLSAQTLKAREATELAERVAQSLTV